MATMEYHAKMLEVFGGPLEEMGPNMKALHERFMRDKDEECIAAESQVVMLFGVAYQRDQEGLPLQDEQDD